MVPIDKAIRESDVGLNPIRGRALEFPCALTEGAVRDLTKMLRAEEPSARLPIPKP